MLNADVSQRKKVMSGPWGQEPAFTLASRTGHEKTPKKKNPNFPPKIRCSNNISGNAELFGAKMTWTKVVIGHWMDNNFSRAEDKLEISETKNTPWN